MICGGWPDEWFGAEIQPGPTGYVDASVQRLQAGAEHLVEYGCHHLVVCTH
jgi:hypothetical protein